MKQNELFTIKEMAAKLKISPRSIYRLEDSGKLPKSIKIGASRRWIAKVVDEWFDAGCPTIRVSRQVENRNR